MFFVITAVSLRDTWNGDIPDWVFYVSSVDFSDSDEYVKIGRYVRRGVAITVFASSEVEPKPTIEQGKMLAKWQYDYMNNPFDINLQEYGSWLTYR